MNREDPDNLPLAILFPLSCAHSRIIEFTPEVVF